MARTITLCRGDLWRVLGRARSVPLGHDLAWFADRHAGAHIDPLLNRTTSTSAEPHRSHHFDPTAPPWLLAATTKQSRAIGATGTAQSCCLWNPTARVSKPIPLAASPFPETQTDIHQTNQKKMRSVESNRPCPETWRPRLHHPALRFTALLRRPHHLALPTDNSLAQTPSSCFDDLQLF